MKFKNIFINMLKVAIGASLFFQVAYADEYSCTNSNIEESIKILNIRERTAARRLTTWEKILEKRQNDFNESQKDRMKFATSMIALEFVLSMGAYNPLDTGAAIFFVSADMHNLLAMAAVAGSVPAFSGSISGTVTAAYQRDKLNINLGSSPFKALDDAHNALSRLLKEHLEDANIGGFADIITAGAITGNMYLALEGEAQGHVGLYALELQHVSKYKKALQAEITNGACANLGNSRSAINIRKNAVEAIDRTLGRGNDINDQVSVPSSSLRERTNY